MNNDCLFCKISAGSIPSEKVYESDTLFAFNDINPQAPTHILIVPRAHHATLLNVEEADHEVMGSIISVALVAHQPQQTARRLLRAEQRAQQQHQ